MIVCQLLDYTDCIQIMRYVNSKLFILICASIMQRNEMCIKDSRDIMLSVSVVISCHALKLRIIFTSETFFWHALILLPTTVTQSMLPALYTSQPVRCEP